MTIQTQWNTEFYKPVRRVAPPRGDGRRSQQRVIVLRAVADGAKYSRDIVSHTGIDLSAVNKQLKRLSEAAHVSGKYVNHMGRICIEWKVTK